MTSTLRKENKPFEPRSWETVPCPFCGSDDATLLERYGTNHRFTHVRCRNCHLTYQNPRPTYDEDFVETAWTVDQDELMGIRSRTHPTEGVQFHPESFLTDTGHQLLKNFLKT